MTKLQPDPTDGKEPGSLVPDQAPKMDGFFLSHMVPFYKIGLFSDAMPWGKATA